MRALLDTNIVYDILCERPFDEQGLTQLKVMHAFGDVELWVSSKTFSDLFYLMHREIGSDKAHDTLEDVFTWASACSIDENDIRRALHVRWQDFEDSLINVCAEKVKADYLVTRDEKGFRNASIPHGCASDFMNFVFEKTNVRYAIDQPIPKIE